jgi:tetratricopeptide (TPR) repeat protein
MPPTPPSGDKKNIVKMAYIYFQEGRWDKAIEEYKKLLLLDPEDINTHNMLGDVFVKKGALREAYDEYTKVVTELNARGQADKAAVVNKKIAALDTDLLPLDARNRQSLIRRTIKAETAMEQGDVQTAIEAFGEVLKLDPDNIGVYSKLAELLVSKGKTAEAVQQYAVMGAAYLKNRYYKKAQEAFQKILELDPNQVEARVNLAQIYIKQGSESDAKKEFLTVAEIYLHQGDLDKAQQYAHKSVEFKGIEAYYILGQVLYKKKQFAEAKLEFENLLRFKVNHVGGLTNLGMVYLELNQLDKAADQFARAQKVDKENPKVAEAFGELNVKKGAKNEAIGFFLQAFAWYQGKKDHKKALEFARKAEAVDNQAPLAVKALAEALADDGQKAEAAKAFAQAADLFEKKGPKDQAAPMRQRAQELGEAPTGGETPKTEAPAAETPKAEKPKAVEPAPAQAAKTEAPPTEVPKFDEVKVEAPKVEASSVPKDVVIAKEAVEAPSDNVLDLEEESSAKAAAAKAAPAPAPVAPPPMAAEKPSEPSQDRETELLSQMEIAANYIRQNLVEDAIEIYQQLLENYPDHPEVRGKLNDAYTLYVKSGDEVIDALEAEKKAKEEEDKRIREEHERKAKAEAERREREEAERKAKEEVERKAKAEKERKLREEAELKAREEALQKAKVENERKAKEEQVQKAKEEAERRLREELEKKVKEEAEKKVREELERRVKEETEKKAKEEAERRLREELEKKVREEAERKAKEEAEHKAKEAAETKAKEAAERKAKEEAERKLREELDRKSKEAAEKARREEELRNQQKEPIRMASGVPDATQSARLGGDDSRDEFMTIAVADIYVRQGLYDEAHKIYDRIVDMEPDNYEAKKKLSDLENVMRAKGMLGTAKASAAPPAPAPSPAPPTAAAPPVAQPPAKAPEAPEPAPSHEKEPVAKKKPGKVGYV